VRDVALRLNSKQPVDTAAAAAKTAMEKERFIESGFFPRGA